LDHAPAGVAGPSVAGGRTCRLDRLRRNERGRGYL